MSPKQRGHAIVRNRAAGAPKYFQVGTAHKHRLDAHASGETVTREIERVKIRTGLGDVPKLIVSQRRQFILRTRSKLARDAEASQTRQIGKKGAQMTRPEVAFVDAKSDEIRQAPDKNRDGRRFGFAPFPLRPSIVSADTKLCVDQRESLQARPNRWAGQERSENTHVGEDGMHEIQSFEPRRGR